MDESTNETRDQNVVSLRLTVCVLNRNTANPDHETSTPPGNSYSDMRIGSGSVSVSGRWWL